MKKITIITAAMVAGGAQRVIAQLINSWVEKENIDIDLILIEKMERFYELPSCVKVTEIGKMDNNPLIDKLKRYGRVRSIIRNTTPDIILSLPEEIGIYVALANIGTGVPLVVSERNNPWVMPNVKITRMLRHIAYCFASGIVFQTTGAKSFFSRKIQNKGVVLPNPLDLNRIPNVYTGQRRKRVVSVGRLDPQKNFALLIEAFEVFYKTHNDYSMIIYGEGKQRNTLQQKIDAIGLEKVIILPGNDKDVLNEIKSASMFVLSSDYEGVPNVLIEAMAMGMPVVATDCKPGGARELICNNNGLLVPTNDKDKLVNAMEYIVNNPDESFKMAQKAVEIKDKLNSEVVSGKWLNYLNQIKNEC